MSEVRAHLLVRGFVQGVGFRYFVCRTAEGLGLAGYAKNLFTGEVEIEVEGDRSLIEELIAKVRVGPRAAHVADIAVEWRAPEHRFTGFEIR